MIYPLECLGRSLISHHTVYLALQECLDSIGTLVISFYLGAIPLLLQFRGKSVTRGTKLHAYHSPLQVCLRLQLLSGFGRFRAAGCQDQAQKHRPETKLKTS